MPRVLLLSALLVAATAVLTPAWATGGRLFGRECARVVHVRKLDNRSKTPSWRLAVTVSGGSATVAVAVTTDGRTLALKPGELTRRASVDVYVGEPGEKGVVTVGLKLAGADGGVVCEGTASLAPAQGIDEAPFVGGVTTCDVVRSVQAFPTAVPGIWSIAFTAAGEASAKIAGGTLWTETLGKDGKPVVSTTPLDDSSFATEREYSTAVRVDGDPVGASSDLEIVVGEDGKQIERVKTSIDFVQLPDGSILGLATVDGGVPSAAARATTETDRYFNLARKVNLWEAP